MSDAREEFEGAFWANVALQADEGPSTDLSWLCDWLADEVDDMIAAARDRAERAERERDVEREHGDAARESNDRLMAALARVAVLVEEFHGHALSASRDSEACDPGDPTQGAYWDGQADAWLEAESSIRDALKEES